MRQCGHRVNLGRREVWRIRRVSRRRGRVPGGMRNLHRLLCKDRRSQQRDENHNAPHGGTLPALHRDACKCGKNGTDRSAGLGLPTTTPRVDAAEGQRRFDAGGWGLMSTRDPCWQGLALVPPTTLQPAQMQPTKLQRTKGRTPFGGLRATGLRTHRARAAILRHEDTDAPRAMTPFRRG